MEGSRSSSAPGNSAPTARPGALAQRPARFGPVVASRLDHGPQAHLRLTPGFLLLTALSSAIATLGLITDSAAVIIGAMLIAPFLAPIMGIGLGALGGRRRLVARAAVTLAVGIGSRWHAPSRSPGSRFACRSVP